MTYSGASCSSSSSRVGRRLRGFEMAADGLDQQRMLRHRKDVRPGRLAVPAGDAGEAVRDVVELDVERGGVEQVEAASGQHSLPGARGFGLRAQAAHHGPCGASARAVGVAEAADEVVVGHADRLHEGVDDGRPAEGEARRLEVFRQFSGEFGLRRHLGAARQPALDRPPVHEPPQETRKALRAPRRRATRARPRSCPRSWRGSA